MLTAEEAKTCFENLDFLKTTIQSVSGFIQLAEKVHELNHPGIVNFPWSRLINNREIFEAVIKCEKDLNDILDFGQRNISDIGNSKKIISCLIIKFCENQDKKNLITSYDMNLFLKKITLYPEIKEQILLTFMSVIDGGIKRNTLTKSEIENVYQFITINSTEFYTKNSGINKLWKEFTETLYRMKISLVGACLRFINTRPELQINAIKILPRDLLDKLNIFIEKINEPILTTGPEKIEPVIPDHDETINCQDCKCKIF